MHQVLYIPDIIRLYRDVKLLECSGRCSGRPQLKSLVRYSRQQCAAAHAYMSCRLGGLYKLYVELLPGATGRARLCVPEDSGTVITHHGQRSAGLLEAVPLGPAGTHNSWSVARDIGVPGRHMNPDRTVQQAPAVMDC